MRNEGIDAVGIQETIKADFRHHELLVIDPLERFVWHWSPARGHSGGMLLGLSNAYFEVLSWETGTFFYFGPR